VAFGGILAAFDFQLTAVESATGFACRRNYRKAKPLYGPIELAAPGNKVDDCRPYGRRL
jgi:hypothetical protein